MTIRANRLRVALSKQQGEPMRSAGELAQVEAAAEIVEQAPPQDAEIVVELESIERVDVIEQDTGEGEG